MRLILVIVPVLVLNTANLFGQVRLGENLSLIADMQAEVRYLHHAPAGNGFFTFPVHAGAGVLYSTGSAEALVSAQIVPDVAAPSGGDIPAAAGELPYVLEPGPSYLRGGMGDSYMKIGYFIERWGVARSLSVVERLNPQDDDHSPDIFSRNLLQPAPLFLTSFGGDTVTQIAVSGGEQGLEEGREVLLGLRAMTTGALSVGVGLVRPAGHPPSLWFLTARSDAGWLELGWRHYPDEDDHLELVLGGRQVFRTASIAGELIVVRAEPLLYLEEVMQIEQGAFGLSTFVNLRTFSTAIDAAFLVPVDERTRFDFGTTLFFGKKGSFFSRWQEGNDNRVYFRLTWSGDPGGNLEGVPRRPFAAAF